MTDAKALYDSYHREGISSSVIDKRVSLEIRVMKERMECLGGSLRWMSSERQIADGLTKESARSLLASRLRHGRLKLTWDPSYTAAKKKTKAQRIEAIKESTTNFEQPPGQEAMREEWNMENEHPLSEHEVTAESHEPQIEHQAENDQELCEFVHYTQNVKPLVYVLSSSHVASRMHTMDLSRWKNVMFFMVCFFMVFAARAEDTCFEVSLEKPTEEPDYLSFWILVLAACHMFAMATVFTVGRWTASSTKPQLADAAAQKEEQVVPQRLRELNLDLKRDLTEVTRRAEKNLAAAQEARAALALQEPEVEALRGLVLDAESLLKALEREMDHHAEMCPFLREIHVSKKGECWHMAGCHVAEQIAPHNLG